jgi:hypothetical protein
VVGAATPTNNDSSIAQSFTLSQPATLSLWYQVICPDTVPYDWATVILRDETAGTQTTLLPRTCVTSSPWTQLTSALGPANVGHAFTLVLTSHDDDFLGDATFTRFDDVALLPSTTPDFAVSGAPGSRTVVAGAGTSYSVATSVAGGFNGSIGLGLSGLPSGATGAFSPTAVLGAGTSTLSITTSPSTPAGSYPLTITGTSGALSHTAPVTLIVNPVPDFSVSASPPSQTVVAGGGTSFSVITSVVGGFNGWIDLSMDGLPDGAVSAPTSVLGAGTSALSITTSPSTVAGSYPLTITGTSGVLSHPTPVTLVVSPVPDFSVAASPPSQAVVAGSSMSYPVATSVVGAFDGPIDLGVSGLPAGATGTFSPTQVFGADFSTLSVTTTPLTAPGSYPLTITGTSGALGHSTSVTLVVNPPGPGFAISVSPATQSVGRGKKVVYTVTVTPYGGFTGKVRLRIKMSPTGPTGAFSPISLRSGTSRLTVNGRHTVGTFRMTISGTSGGISSSAVATIIVTA